MKGLYLYILIWQADRQALLITHYIVNLSVGTDKTKTSLSVYWSSREVLQIT